MRLTRSEDPGPYREYRDYKPHLQELFRQRCAYCISHEDTMGRYEAMEVDHFRPKKSRPEFKHLENAWTNLYYCCRRCNSYKSNHWPSQEQEAEGMRFVDPCAENPDDYICLPLCSSGKDSCRVEPRTRAGSYTIEKIRLNRPQLREIRRKQAREEQKYQASLARIRQCIAFVTSDATEGRTAPDKQAVLRDLRREGAGIRKRVQEFRALRSFQP